MWMGNARGNKNSRQHVSLDPDHEKEKHDFFDFSFEEIGIFDVASMIDYILDHTGIDKLHYIGHSQGGTVFFVLASMRPEYNKKLQSVHLLAGVGYMEYFPDAQLASVAVFTDLIYVRLYIFFFNSFSHYYKLCLTDLQMYFYSFYETFTCLYYLLRCLLCLIASL